MQKAQNIKIARDLTNHLLQPPVCLLLSLQVITQILLTTLRTFLIHPLSKYMWAPTLHQHALGLKW